MINFCVIAIVFLAGAFVFLKWLNMKEWHQFAAAVLIIISISVFLGGALTMDEYYNFIETIEIQRAQVDTILADNPLNMHYMVDIAETNRQLAELQARYQRWRWATWVPAEVMDIKPIGAK